MRTINLRINAHLKVSEVACDFSAGEVRKYITKHCCKHLSSIDVMQCTGIWYHLEEHKLCDGRDL